MCSVTCTWHIRACTLSNGGTCRRARAGAVAAFFFSYFFFWTRGYGARAPAPLSKHAQFVHQHCTLRLHVLNVPARRSSAFGPWFGGEETVQPTDYWCDKWFYGTSLTLYLRSFPSLSSVQAFLRFLCLFWRFIKFTVNLRKWQWLNLLLLGRSMADITVWSLWDISDNNYMFLLHVKTSAVYSFTYL